MIVLMKQLHFCLHFFSHAEEVLINLHIMKHPKQIGCVQNTQPIKQGNLQFEMFRVLFNCLPNFWLVNELP